MEKYINAAILAICISAMVWVPVGCKGGTTSLNVAQEIVNYVPALDAAANTVSSTIEALVPADALIVGVADAAFIQLSTAVSAAAKAYLVSPSPSALTNLQTTIVALQQSVSTALLNSVGIKNPQTLKLVQAALNGLVTIVLTLLGLVQSVSTKAQLKAMSDAETIKLARVEPLLDSGKMQTAANAYSVTPSQYFDWETQHGF